MSPKLHHVGLSVADLDAAVEWYGRALSYEVAFRGETPTMRVTMGALSGGGGLELLERRDSATRGWGHIALDVEDIDATYAHLIAAGAGAVWPPRQSPEPGVSMAFVHDPEGNLIELVSRDGGR